MPYDLVTFSIENLHDLSAQARPRKPSSHLLPKVEEIAPQESPHFKTMAQKTPLKSSKHFDKQ